MDIIAHLTTRFIGLTSPEQAAVVASLLVALAFLLAALPPGRPRARLGARMGMGVLRPAMRRPA